MLTVKMSNLTDKRCFKPTFLDNPTLSTTAKRTGFFLDKNSGFESSFVTNKTNPNISGVLQASQSGENFQLNQTFKIPDFESLPVKKTTVKSINPRPSAKPNMVKSGLKQGQQSKISLIPRPSFIISRKSLHGSRNAQLNARKELLKQMVFLHECNIKGRKELKKSTPVKVLAGLTPKKTPRSGGYFVLPEFSKKVPKLEDIRTPIQDLVKKEMFPYSSKQTAPREQKNESSPYLLNETGTADFIKKPKKVVTEIKHLPNQRVRFNALLTKCKLFNAEMSGIYEELKVVDNTFESKIKDLPDYRVYNEFCFYKSKKEDLYLKLQKLEAEFTNFASTHTKIGKELEAYIARKQELFEEHISIHRSFEQTVTSALEESGKDKVEEKKGEETQSKPESPALRRSLRLAKIKKNKFEERSPLSRRLRKVDIKSKGIHKA